MLPVWTFSQFADFYEVTILLYHFVTHLTMMSWASGAVFELKGWSVVFIYDVKGLVVALPVC